MESASVLKDEDILKLQVYNYKKSDTDENMYVHVIHKGMHDKAPIDVIAPLMKWDLIHVGDTIEYNFKFTNSVTEHFMIGIVIWKGATNSLKVESTQGEVSTIYMDELATLSVVMQTSAPSSSVGGFVEVVRGDDDEIQLKKKRLSLSLDYL
jgi:hypothetical protein